MPSDYDSPQAGYQTRTDRAYVEEMIGAFVSNPGLRQMLTDAFDSALGKNFSAHLGPPGSQVAFGSTTAFAPTDVGANLANTMHDQAVTATMGEAFRRNEEMRIQEREQFYRALYGSTMDPGQIQRQANQAPIMGNFSNFTNLAADFLYNSYQPEQLLSGLEVGARYMGVGATYGAVGADTDVVARQDRIRQEVSAMSTAIQNDFVSKPEEYGGLSGQGVGQLYAEIARTGGFNEARQGSDGDIEKLQQETIRITQQAAQSVQAFRQIFNGSVTEVLDQVNALMGVDVTQTFEDGGRNMVQNLASSGFVTGYNPQQVASLAGMSSRMAQAAGVDSMGSIASATMATQLLGVHRQEGTGNAFINQRSFRENMVRRSLGAQESGFARDIAGGYALVEQYGGSTEGFLAEIADAQSAEDIARAASNNAGDAGRGAFSAMDLRNASFSEAGERARADGIGGLQALQFNASVIENTRRSIVQRELAARGVAQSDIRAVTAAMSEPGGTTVDNIMSSLEGVQGVDQVAFSGNLRRIFGQQAQSLGLGRNANEADAMLRAISNRDALRAIQTTAAGRSRLQDLFANRGNQFGLQNLERFVDEIDAQREASPDGSVDVGFQDLVRGFTGADDVDIDDIESFTGISRSMLEQYQGEDGDALAALGLSTAVESLFTQQFDGKLLGETDRKEMQRLLSEDMSDEERRKGFRGLAKRMHGDRIFEAQATQFQTELNKKLKLEGAAANKTAEVSRRSVSLDQLAALEEGELKLAASDEAKGEFAKDISKFNEFFDKKVEAGETDFDKIADEFFKGDKSRKSEFMDRWKQEAMVNENVSLGNGLSGGPMGTLIELVRKIAEFLEDHRKNP